MILKYPRMKIEKTSISAKKYVGFEQKKHVFANIISASHKYDGLMSKDSSI